MESKSEKSALRQPIVTVCGHVDHGKCVSGDTLIQLASGEIVEASRIFERLKDDNELEKIDDGYLQDVSSKNILVCSFDGKDIVQKRLTHIWKREAKKIVEIKLASGDILRTTPEHPFFMFSLGKLPQKNAEQLSAGDYLAVPRHVKINSSQFMSSFIERMASMDNAVCFLNDKFDSVFEQIHKINVKEFERKNHLSNIGDCLRKKRFRIKDLFKIGGILGISNVDICSCIGKIKNANEGWRVGHTSNAINLPNEEQAEKLGYILGCIVGDGHLTKTTTSLTNNDSEVQEAYKSYLKDIFDVETKIRVDRGVSSIFDNGSMTLRRVFTEIFDIPVGDKSGIVTVPEIVKRNKELFRGFLAGLFDTDGYVSHLNYCIEITSKSERLIKECGHLLLQFGIHSSIYEKIVKGEKYYNLRISNKEYLGKFLTEIRSRLTRKVERIINALKKAETSRIFDFIPVSGEVLNKLDVVGKINRKVPFFSKYKKLNTLSISFIKKAVENVRSENEFSRLLKNSIERQISFVKVISKREIDNPDKWVYDFTIEDTHNFVANRTILHNTSILDCFRGSSLQEDEAGGITQKISFTKYPLEQIYKACPLIEKGNVTLEIPGFLFIDTPGHAAFTNLRKRGGALADLAILVVSIKDGIKPQTAEVLQILRSNKTPFLIALNKIDSISGWKDLGNIKESVLGQAQNVNDEFQEALLTFQGSLKEQGFDSDLFYEVNDFTKKIAIVPCSARTGSGISELLFVLCGLCQKFLKERLKVSEQAKGVILEVKKDKSSQYAEAILYDGYLDEGDELVVASFNEPIVGKVRSIQEILPLENKFRSVKQAVAATGVRMQLTNSDGLLPGMPFQEVKGKAEMEKVKLQFKKEISSALPADKQGIIIKAESLGSLEALITLLKQENIPILKAGIGPIGKSDVTSAKANIEINPLDAIIIGFNVNLEEGVEPGHVKVISNEVIYKLIEDLSLWRKEKNAQIEKEKLMQLATVCKIEILPNYVFRNSNPAIFGVRMGGGRARVGLPLIDDRGEEVGRIKGLQVDKVSVEEAKEGQELALSIPGIYFDRRLKDVKFLYANISEKQFKKFKENKELLSASELKVLQEISLIKKF